MGDNSTIEWTDATWNPVRGCSIVSKGCTNCYAMRQAHRSHGAGGAYEGLTKLTKGGPVWTGEVRTVPALLEQPLKWARPRRIFVNSMSDLFHDDVPDDFIDSVLTVIKRCEVAGKGHTFQVLTKRAERMQRFMAEVYSGGAITPMKNLWLGVSVEDQAAADERIPLLLQTPAAVRWISAEPLLGRINIERWMWPLCWHWASAYKTPEAALAAGAYAERKPQALVSAGRAFISWVVAGGESGPGARPMHPDWARALRDQCKRVNVPFFFKQWGNWMEVDGAHRDQETGDHRLIEVPGHEAEDTFDPSSDCLIAADGRIFRKLEDLPADTLCRQMTRGPKKWCGRELDGRTHDEYPA